MKNTVKQHLNRTFIAPEGRVGEEKDEIDLLLEGKVIELDFEELQDVISNITMLDINTLSIQKSGWLYYIKVDELTIEENTRGVKMTYKQHSLNRNRAISIATKFIPKESMKLYYAELCKGCKCDNDTEEYLACCYCQNGSLYEEEIL